MSRLFKGLGLILVVIFVGCAVPMEELTPEQQEYVAAVRAVELNENNRAGVVVSEADAKTAWERTQVFISKYSSMKIQTATDVLVETYNANELGEYAYKATRLTVSEGTEVEVWCVSGSWLNAGNAKMNTRILAHYVATDELMPEFVNKLHK